MAIRLLHFADAHIDMVNYGRHDPETALPVRVVDFLKSLDAIVERALEEPVDLVIFAGDAYKDRNPHPTFQREWGKRMMRLSRAGIPTILLVGNHDVPAASGRAHAIAEFSTLEVPHIFVADRIGCYDAQQLGISAQVITIPWVPRSHLMTRQETAGKPLAEVLLLIEQKVTGMVQQLLEQADPSLPTILTAHASVQGAVYGSERQVMLGHELVLSGGLVTDPRLDYVALGHIHKHQNLNPKGHPPVIYPGSIERIDFSEARETKGFVLATVDRGETQWEFVPLQTRPFVDRYLSLDGLEKGADPMEVILAHLPAPEALEGAIVRLVLEYPPEVEPRIDDAALYRHARLALDFHLVKRRVQRARARLGDIAAVESLSPVELLERYWRAAGTDPDEAAILQEMGAEIIRAVEAGEGNEDNEG